MESIVKALYQPKGALFTLYFLPSLSSSPLNICIAVFGLPSLRIRGFYLVVATLAAQFFILEPDHIGIVAEHRKLLRSWEARLEPAPGNPNAEWWRKL